MLGDMLDYSRNIEEFACFVKAELFFVEGFVTQRVATKRAFILKHILFSNVFEK